ncbi:MAG: SRPBCC domain-containing protein [Parvibaculaceae bacterium]
MSKPVYVYVTYIRTTAEKLWQALIDPAFTRQYWVGAHLESDWQKGSDWKIVFADGRVADTGEIIEIEPMKRLVIRWRNEACPSSRRKAIRAARSRSRLTAR